MPTWCSASQLFVQHVQHGAISLLAVIRKQQFSLLRSLCCVIMLLSVLLLAPIVFGIPYASKVA